MPIAIDADLRFVSQQEFGLIAYEVMEVVFAVHNELGRLLDEAIYQREIARRIPEVQIEVPIAVMFDSFSKTYFLDLLIANAAPFELKAVECLTDRHRAQLVNYLLLTELQHGKLVTFRPESVEHEFVNSTHSRADRTEFDVIDLDWQQAAVQGQDIREWLVGAIRDWGTGLDTQLYTEACTHFFGGEDQVLSNTEIVFAGQRLGTQPVRLARPGVAFKVTTISQKGFQTFEEHARRFLENSSLRAIQWINVTRGAVTFKTLRKSP